MPSPRAPALAYTYADGVYLNITSRCPTSCVFCAKFSWDWGYRGFNLLLAREPSAAEVLEAARERLAEAPRAEAVFCGYGEPTMRLDVLLEAARGLRRESPRLRLRLNTVGLGSAVHGRDISPELAAGLDAVSVSLNTAVPEQWRRLHRPRPDLAGRGFEEVKAFVKACVGRGLETTVTAVEQPDVDLVKVELVARGLGARFRLRPTLEGTAAQAAQARKAAGA